MVALSRLRLFVFTYSTMFFIDATVEKNIKSTFQGLMFHIISFGLLLWTNLNHQSKELNEIFYTFSFLCMLTSLGCFL